MAVYKPYIKKENGSISELPLEANKVANPITIKLNGGTTEGTNQYTYDGSKSITTNITPSSIGASPSSHTHTKSEVGLGNVDNTADADKSVNYANSAGSVAWNNVTSKPTLYLHSLKISFTSSGKTYTGRANILSTNNTKITSLAILRDVCKDAKNINDDAYASGGSAPVYSYTMPVEGVPSNQTSSTSQNYMSFRVHFVYDSNYGGSYTLYLYYLTKANLSSIFNIVSSSSPTLSDTITTIYGGA